LVLIFAKKISKLEKPLIPVFSSSERACSFYEIIMGFLGSSLIIFLLALPNKARIYCV
jgi:hypothetical protein